MKREKILSDLESDAAELQYGIDSRNPEVVSHIALDKSYYNKLNFNWLCAECPFYYKCIEMRARERGSDYKP
jgi:hypothetical protein